MLRRGLVAALATAALAAGGADAARGAPDAGLDLNAKFLGETPAEIARLGNLDEATAHLDAVKRVEPMHFSEPAPRQRRAAGEEDSSVAFGGAGQPPKKSTPAAGRAPPMPAAAAHHAPSARPPPRHRGLFRGARRGAPAGGYGGTNPCARWCDRRDGWKTSDCQECIFRGLVNGYTSQASHDKGSYDYNAYASRSCKVYEAQAFHLGLKRKPFFTCFFDHVHKACNM